MQKRLITEINKYHFGDGKAEAMVYCDFHTTRLQEQSCDYYRNLSEEKEKKNRTCKELI